MTVQTHCFCEMLTHVHGKLTYLVSDVETQFHFLGHVTQKLATGTRIVFHPRCVIQSGSHSNKFKGGITCFPVVKV